jgi:hypothetical protein
VAWLKIDISPGYSRVNSAVVVVGTAPEDCPGLLNSPTAVQGSDTEMNIIFVTSISFIVGCEYRPDRLMIENKSSSDICYEPILLMKQDSTFRQASTSGTALAQGADHPGVRLPIAYQLDNYSLDKKLYVVFFNCNDRGYVFKNLRTVVFNKRFIVRSFDKNELDSLGWVIKYTGGTSTLPIRISNSDRPR